MIRFHFLDMSSNTSFVREVFRRSPLHIRTTTLLHNILSTAEEVLWCTDNLRVFFMTRIDDVTEFHRTSVLTWNQVVNTLPKSFGIHEDKPNWKKEGF